MWLCNNEEHLHHQHSEAGERIRPSVRHRVSDTLHGYRKASALPSLWVLALEHLSQTTGTANQCQQEDEGQFHGLTPFCGYRHLTVCF
jgi:hypothetical protein